MTATKREQIKQRADAISKAAAEMRRLAQVLEYYAWMEEWNFKWSDIKGVTDPIVLTSTIKYELKVTIRNCHRWNEHQLREWCTRPPKSARAISYKLKDGRTLVLPFPPFPHNVVYNRQNEPETWTKKDSRGGSIKARSNP